jgi:hypothetical protein
MGAPRDLLSVRPMFSIFLRLIYLPSDSQYVILLPTKKKTPPGPCSAREAVATVVPKVSLTSTTPVQPPSPYATLISKTHSQAILRASRVRY